MTETRGEIFQPNVLDNAKVRVLDNGSSSQDTTQLLLNS